MAIKIKVSRKAIQGLISGPEIAADLLHRAAAIAAAAGDGMEYDGTAGGAGGRGAGGKFLGARRARAYVWTDTNDARRAEAVDRALTRAIDAGRS